MQLITVCVCAYKIFAYMKLRGFQKETQQMSKKINDIKLMITNLMQKCKSQRWGGMGDRYVSIQKMPLSQPHLRNHLEKRGNEP